MTNGGKVGGAMQQLHDILLLLLLLSTYFCLLAQGQGVSCLWEEFFHIGHNLSGACRMSQPAPPSCRGQFLRLAADGRFLLPNHHTRDAANFTVPATNRTHLRLRCELACPEAEPIAACDITVHGGYPPPAPSTPRCHIPSDGPDLHCDWDPGGPPLLPTTYTLRWEPVVIGSRFPGSVRVSTASAIIPRREIQQQRDMSVWIIASNRLGTERSQKSIFNTGAVKKPCPPVFAGDIARSADLEILWDFQCPSAVLTDTSDVSCWAQHRRQGQHLWTEGEDVAQDHFLLDGLQPFTVYMFRVRCACPGSDELSSDWSSTYTARTTEAAPVGVLDVWSDSREMDQAVVWKARGRVLGYLVAVERAGGNRTELNVSAEELRARTGGSTDIGLCCRLPHSVLGVTGVGVSAYTSQGHTSPAPLALPTSGDPVPGLLSVSMAIGRRGFNVSWDPPTTLSETIQEYVVQQEEAGLHFTRGFDWTRTNKTQRSIVLAGDFRNYTPYNLSLFGVFGGRSRLLASVIAYTRQGVPPIVPEFQVSRISSSAVTLSWKHIPLTQSRGVIQCYLLGQGNGTEYTVSGDSTSLQVSGLQPGQTYQFWIVARTEAGEGPRRTLEFSTPNTSGQHVFILLAMAFLLTFGMFGIPLLCSHRREVYSVLPAWCSERIPDLTDSRLFMLMQTPVWTGPCPAVEPDPSLCLLEVVEAPAQKGRLGAGEEVQDQEEAGEQQEWEESGRTGSAGGSMVECNKYETAADGPQIFTDYEKHFMPCPSEMLFPGTYR